MRITTVEVIKRKLFIDDGCEVEKPIIVIQLEQIFETLQSRFVFGGPCGYEKQGFLAACQVSYCDALIY